MNAYRRRATRAPATLTRRLRRRVSDTLFVAALFPIFYVLALLLDREDRKAGVR